VVSTLVLPSRAKSRLREGLVEEFLLLGSLFVAVMERYRGKPAEKLAQLRRDVEANVEANALLLAAARNEPSGGVASLEGLSLLHQFGRELEDVVQALELASAQRVGEEKVDGRYAAQLEPELGTMARDIYRGFQFMGGCIHRWKFDVAPEDFSLAKDVAALEEKMAAVRPTGFNYPQEEIFRAYAVQLHLKQLARLLRSSRVETSETIG
jgi:hypothetical protein